MAALKTHAPYFEETAREAQAGAQIVLWPEGAAISAREDEAELIAQVPTRGTGTIYPVIDDLFGWLAVAGFVALVIYGIVLGRRARAAEAQIPGEEDLAPAN